jgi:hypothetical protein
MTLEEEKRYVLLASSLDVGGKAKKHEALDNIEAKGYLKLNASDLERMPNRHELYWRNDLAYIRKHVVMGRYLDGSRFNNWEITQKGRDYFRVLSATILGERHLRKLSPAAVRRASQ